MTDTQLNKFDYIVCSPFYSDTFSAIVKVTDDSAIMSRGEQFSYGQITEDNIDHFYEEWKSKRVENLADEIFHQIWNAMKKAGVPDMSFEKVREFEDVWYIGSGEKRVKIASHIDVTVADTGQDLENVDQVIEYFQN